MDDSGSFLRWASVHPSSDNFPQRPLIAQFSSSNIAPYLCLLPVLFVVVKLKLFSPVRIRWYHADRTVTLGSKQRGQIQLSQFCRSITPSCYLHPLLRSRHLQTLFPMYEKRWFPLYFRRMIFESHNEQYRGTFAVDLTAPKSSEQDPDLPPRTSYYSEEVQETIGSQDSRPMLVTLHGLCGGSHEQYLQRVLAPLVTSEQKWEACVVLSRGCGQSEITGGGMYYAHATSDIRQVVKWLRTTFPNRPLYAVGFSMGANILTRYVAEEGEDCAFQAAVVISNPWNLETTALHLQRTWLGRHLYSPAMTANLMQVFDENAEHLETVEGEQLEMKPVKKVHLLHEYDRYIQCQTWGFPTERVYYREASSSDAVMEVKIPFWAINSEDDPIVGPESIPKGEFQVSPYTVLSVTGGGGHLGWVQTKGERWYATAVVAFLQKMYSVQ